MRQSLELSGKTIVLTGASSGIGAAAAVKLAAAGADVVPVGRSESKTAAVAQEIGTQPLTADFSDLSQVRRLAQQILERCPRIDILAHNAGAIVPHRKVTVDGHELTFQSNHLAPFLLHSLLSDRLSESRARVIVTSSLAHRAGDLRLDDPDFAKRHYRPGRAYAAAKLANVLFTKEIARHSDETGVTAVCFHPGLVRSNFAHDSDGVIGMFYRSRLGRALSINNQEGAAPLVRLATIPDHRHINGDYFDRVKGRAATSRKALDPELARGLWEISEMMTSGA